MSLVRERAVRDGGARAPDAIDIGGTGVHHVDAEDFRPERVMLVEPLDGRHRRGRQGDSPPHPHVRKGARAIPEERDFTGGLRHVRRHRKSFLPGPDGHGAVERAAHGIRRVGRHADPDAFGGEAPALGDAPLQALKARLALRRIRPEHFVVDDAAAARLVQRFDDRSGIARIGDRGDAGGEAVGDALSRSAEEMAVVEGCLERDDPADPVGEVGGLDCAGQPRELEVRVGIHEPGHQRTARMVSGDGVGWSGNGVVGSRRDDPAVGADQHRPAWHRGSVHRKEPVGAQAAHARISEGRQAPG